MAQTQSDPTKAFRDVNSPEFKKRMLEIIKDEAPWLQVKGVADSIVWYAASRLAEKITRMVENHPTGCGKTFSV